MQGTVKAVFDIDSPMINRFSEADQQGIEQLVQTFTKACDWQWSI
ncbi:hypothetical protein ACPUEK_10015 [Marinomonas gallaica]